MFNFKIRTRFLIPLLILIVLLNIGQGLLTMQYGMEIQERELSKKVNLLREKMSDKSKVLTHNLAIVVARALAQMDFTFIEAIVEQSSKEITDLVHLSITNKEGKILFSSLQEYRNKVYDLSSHQKETYSTNIVSLHGKEVQESIHLIQLEENVLGSVILGLDYTPVIQEITTSQEDGHRSTVAMLWYSLIIGGCIILLGVIVVVWTVGHVTAPLVRLTTYVKNIHEDNLETVAIPECHRRDEIGILSRVFQEMVLRVCSFVHQLKELNVSLETKVRDRTQELHDKALALEEAHQKILDSINYAKRIQKTILPYNEDLETLFSDHFVIWEPKDWVGGDFYWLHECSAGLLVAVVDCTGHGVPGAMMSMAAFSNMKQLVDEENCINPGKMIMELNRSFMHSRYNDRQSERVNDGLDLGLCFISWEGRQMIYAGAKTDLFLSGPDGIKILQGDFLSVGDRRTHPDHIFTNHTVELPQNAWIYMMTDGFYDQMGGKRRFSFGQKRLLELLQSCNGLNGQQHKEKIIQALISYQGDTPQTDDKTFLGFKHPLISRTRPVAS
ncbi:MAG: SpoIIE family protein phosphatase [Magnetococcus sp. YQC-5]